MTLKEYVHEILECDYSVIEYFRIDNGRNSFTAKIDGHWNVIGDGVLKGVVGFGNTKEDALEDLIETIRGQKITNNGHSRCRNEINVPSSLTLE